MLLYLLLSGAFLHFASAFKAEEFKKCADSSFCARNRLKNGPAFTIAPESVSVTNGKLSALMVNSEEGAQFDLQVSAFRGVLRLTVDEKVFKGRYRVPDILAEDLNSRAVSIDKKRTEITATSATVSYPEHDARLVLQFRPLVLTLEVKGEVALQVNSEGLLAYEHKRHVGEKKANDPPGWWDEAFRGHKDAKPRGPQAISLDLALPGVKHVFGLPERATSFALRPTADLASRTPLGEPYRLYNLDVFEYEHDHPFGLYGSIPLLVAHKKGRSLGVFWLNAAEMYVDIMDHAASGGSLVQWQSESGILDLFLLLGPTPAAVLEQYASLTGTTALPQLFALGYHQCRWNYRDQADVEQVDAGFDAHGFPYDVLWLDIEHTDGKRYLTWDKALFPEPARMEADLASRGRKMVTIVDPHVKRDPEYWIFSEAERLGHYVQTKDGADFEGWCWPGSSSYLDMTSPAVRDWWADQFALSKYPGSTPSLYIWNDMNEPSVFNGPEITMQKDNLHYGGQEHRDVHNLYGLYYHMATAEGLKRRGFASNPGRGDRPFVLSRAFFSGTQRVGPIWTGDNAADWNHLTVSLPMTLTLGMTGLTFSGADVGGFFGNPDSELLTRWYQLGIFYPFLRAHAHLETKRREPWLFDADTLRRLRSAVQLRYALLPYTYTLFRAANESGAPVLRPLVYEFPEEEALFGTDDHAMFGPALLVRPVTEAGASSVGVHFPEGAAWYSYASGARVAPRREGEGGRTAVPVNMEGIPLFLRSGTILPRRDRVRRSTKQMASDPITLIVTVAEDGTAEGELYVDDGASYAFAARREFVHRRFELRGGRLSNRAARVSRPTGLQADLAIERVVFVGLGGDLRRFSASVLGGGRTLEAAPGPMPAPFGVDPAAAASNPEAVLVLRQPGLALGEDWTIELRE